MKQFICLLVVLIVVLWAGAALAEETESPEQAASPAPTEYPAPTESPEEQAVQMLKIDTRHIYDGMKKSYQDGYRPAIQKDEAVLVLPVLAEGLQGPLTVSLNLGEASSSPFVYQNYQREFAKEVYPFPDGQVECYLIRFSLPLCAQRANGNYPVTLTIQGKTEQEQVLTADYTLYVVIDDAEPASSPEKDAGSEPPQASDIQPSPKLMVVDYALDAAYLEAGGTGKLKVTVKNTSASYGVKNIKFSFLEESGEILPLKTSSGYCEEIKKGGEFTWEIALRAVPGATSKPHMATVTMEYEDHNGLATTMADQVILDIRQQARLEYEQPLFPERVIQGDTPSFSMNLMNMGKSTLWNVLLTFDIPGLSSGGSVLVGTMEPGEAKMGTANFYVDDSFLGETSGTLLLSYEDDYGQRYQREFDVHTVVEKRPEQPIAQPQEKEEKTFPWEVYIPVGLAAGTIAAVLITRAVKRKKKREEEEKLL